MGLYKKKIYNAFLYAKDALGLYAYKGKNRKLQKDFNLHFVAKNVGYAPGGIILEISRLCLLKY